MLGAKYMMIDFGENVAQCVLDGESCSAKSIMERRLGRTDSTSTVSYALVARTCLTLVKSALRNERGRTTRQTLARRQ